MRPPLLLLSITVALAAADTAAAAETSTQRALREAKEYLIECPKGEELELCTFEQDQFVRQYVSAKSGDFNDQKNVAYVLYKGYDGYVRKNIVQSCAWYLVTIGSGHSRIENADRIMPSEVCSLLDEAAKPLAISRATTIDAEIRRSPARPLPQPKPRKAPTMVDTPVCPIYSPIEKPPGCD